MANYAITAASVRPGSAAIIRDGTAAATIAQGDVIYQTATSGWYNLASAGSASTDNAAGISLNGASSGQPVKFVVEDADFTHGLTSAVVGGVLCLSATAGKIAPHADITTGVFSTILGVVTSATKAKIRCGTIHAAEVAHV